MKPRLVVIGAGIAGLSCAAQAAEDFAVTVLEAEAQPGYHTSGRSAAVYIEPYMNATVHALTVASLSEHRAMGATPIGNVTIADHEHTVELDDFLAEWSSLCPSLREIDPSELLAGVPILRREQVARAVMDANAYALDVHGLLDGYRRRLLAAGGVIITSMQVTAIERLGANGWRVFSGERQFAADVVVNAAGAWGDDIAGLAGVSPLGLTPMRRTALLLDLGMDVSSWPIVHRVQGGLYFKPEGSQLMVSLADETPSPACDAQPEDIDLAVTVERFQEMTSIEVRRLGRTWAGLRTFLPDRIPAVGYDPIVPGFFWLVGQGGMGMQTAPALGLTASSLLAGRDTEFATALSPGRLAARPMPV